jgi:hypothetical protein
LSLAAAPLFPAAAADVALRTVRGDIVAVNSADTPPVIVLKTETPKHEELIVGAIVDGQTVILRGDQAATLGELKPGEPVTLRYLKTEHGLVARLIRAE